MATTHDQPVVADRDGPADTIAAPWAHARSPDLPRFRFGLRQFFWFVTGVSALLAVMTLADAMVAMGLLVAVAIVAAHVGSTVLGSRLRADADRLLTGRAKRHLRPPGASPPAGPQPTAARMPISPLHERRRALGFGPLLIVAGLIVGGLTGLWLLEMTVGHRTSPAGIVLGAVSFAVLGGWAAFLGGNFYAIARRVWNQAVDEQTKDRRPARSSGR